MAERNRRPPSGKIAPGTPHPTKAYTVRGYDGRWISRKAFLAAKRKKENSTAKLEAKPKSQKPKGGSLVKRVSSAVKKSTKGDLLKIKKGDKGIVRAIKDTYKLGKDTRKSADAVYNAGKLTRKAHDQLVKGSKEFVKGTREAGKATRRAYERLKPGGKIVKSKGSKLTKYTKPASKIVRSPGGKLYRPQGGKLAVRPTDKGGAIVKTPKVKTKAKVTPKVESARRISAKDKLAQAKRGVNKDTAFNRKYKVEGSSTNPRRVTKGGKVISEVNQGKGIKPKKLFRSAVNQAKRIKNVKGSGTALKILGKGSKLVERVALPLALIDNTAGAIRQGGNIYRRAKGQPLLEDIGGLGKAEKFFQIKEKNAYLKEHGSMKGFHESRRKKNKQLKINKTQTPENKTQTPENKTTTNKKKDSSSGQNQVTWKKIAKSVDKKGPTEKEKEAKERKEWEKKTKNSPARKSGAFSDEQLWEIQKKHREWKKKNNRK